MTAREELQKKLADLQEQNAKWSKAFNECMSYQQQGMDCEKSNDFSGAIKAYRECLAYNETVEDIIGSLRCLHSVERLAIIYRKLKWYDDEQNVLEYALKFDISDEYRTRFEKRLEKVTNLKQKQQ